MVFDAGRTCAAAALAFGVRRAPRFGTIGDAMHDEAPRILLDANVLVANFRPSNAFELLLEGARSEQVVLVVPELVVQEASAKYRETMGDRVAELEKSLSRLRRVGVDVVVGDPPDPEA